MAANRFQHITDRPSVKSCKTQRPTSFVERLEAHLANSSASSSGCLEWDGPLNFYGYPELTCRGRRYRIHRLLFAERHGPIPEGMEVCHTCDNPACVNLDHLFLGTHKENMDDMRTKGRAKVYPGVDHKGQRNHNAKFTPEIVLAIRSAWESGDYTGFIGIAKAFNMSRSQAEKIIKKQAWAHITGPSDG